MNRFDPSRIAIPLLAIASLLLIAGVGFWIYQSHRTWTVTIAAGAKGGESHVLATALKMVVEQQHPQLKITVRETGGTSENLALLEKREADLATAQADVPAGRSAQLVAILYADAFQLLVPKDAPEREFSDLAGKRIALPTRGGQFQSFIHVAAHYGYTPSNFKFVDDSTGEAFLAGKAEALFRVRALANPGITKLARAGHVRLIPIEQAAAMRIRTPAFEPGVVPQGAYLGNPPTPERDTNTVLVQRTLLAHNGTPEAPVRWITACLLEDREAIGRAIPEAFADVRPLLSSMRKPDPNTSFGGGVHNGAQQYYERDKPSFVQSNADFVALILSSTLLFGSWLWELKRWLLRKQKNHADAYNRHIIELLNRAQASTSQSDLAVIRTELTRILTVSVQDLDDDRISEESFQSLRVLWQIAIDTVRERDAAIQAHPGHGLPATAT